MRELRVVVRAPGAVLFDGPVAGVRFPTPTGQAGLRPGAERLFAALSPGLVELRRDVGTLHAGTAGGVVAWDGDACTLYSPFAAVGAAEEVLAALAAASSDRSGELEARRRLAELEHRIVDEAWRRGGARP